MADLGITVNDARVALRQHERLPVELVLACTAEPMWAGPCPHPSGGGVVGVSDTTVAHLTHLSVLGWPPDGEVIVEWGGGYGNLARLTYHLGRFAQHVIVDVPPMLAVQHSYLGACGVRAAPWLPGEPRPDAPVLLRPTAAVEEVTGDVFVALRSLSECSEEAVRRVAGLDWSGASQVLLWVDKGKPRTFPGGEALTRAAAGFERVPSDWAGSVYLRRVP